MNFLFRMLNNSWTRIKTYHSYNDQTVLLIPMIPFIPIAGWLADVRYGNFKVFRFGVLLLFISTVLT